MYAAILPNGINRMLYLSKTPRKLKGRKSTRITLVVVMYWAKLITDFMYTVIAHILVSDLSV